MYSIVKSYCVLYYQYFGLLFLLSNCRNLWLVQTLHVYRHWAQIPLHTSVSVPVVSATRQKQRLVHCRQCIVKSQCIFKRRTYWLCLLATGNQLSCWLLLLRQHLLYLFSNIHNVAIFCLMKRFHKTIKYILK